MIIKYLKNICLQLLSRLVCLLMEMGIEGEDKRNEDTFQEENNEAIQEVTSSPDLNHIDFPKPILLLKGPDQLYEPSLMNLDYDNEQTQLKHQDRLTASTSTIFGSNYSINSQVRRSRSSISEEDLLHKSPSELQRQCVWLHSSIEEDRRWLKYRVDSVTKEQAIVFSVLGQMLLWPDEITGSRQVVPTPEDAKQILLIMTYGDYWVLQNLYLIMGFYDRVNNIIGSLDGRIDLRRMSRRTLESIISRHIDIQKLERM